MSTASKVQSLNITVALFVIAELVLTGCVLAVGRDWTGVEHGAATNQRARVTALSLSATLLLAVAANVALVLWRLVRAPADLGNKDEITITAAAIAVLWWTDVLQLRKSVRRRRAVADLLAKFPTFRFGTAEHASPTSDGLSDREFVVRSAHWTLHTEALNCGRSRYRRGHVVRFFESARARSAAGGALVVLYDQGAQVEAGGELLSAQFTHVGRLNRRYVAQVVWRTVQRSRVWAIESWEPGFRAQMIGVLRTKDGVLGMLDGQLGSVAGRADDSHVGSANELCRLLWAAVTLEVLDFIATGTQMWILPAFANEALHISSAAWNATVLIESVKSFRTCEFSQ